MKTISIRLEDHIYDELDEMLGEMGQSKQSFYETYTKTALRERSIPFVLPARMKLCLKKKKWKPFNVLKN